MVKKCLLVFFSLLIYFFGIDKLFNYDDSCFNWQKWREKKTLVIAIKSKIVQIGPVFSDRKSR